MSKMILFGVLFVSVCYISNVSSHPSDNLDLSETTLERAAAEMTKKFLQNESAQDLLEDLEDMQKTGLTDEDIVPQFNNFEPIHYNLNFDSFSSNDMLFGDVTIKILVKKNNKDDILISNGTMFATVESIRPQGSETEVNYSTKSEFSRIRITLFDTLLENTEYIIKIKFHNTVASNQGAELGMYVTNYRDIGQEYLIAGINAGEGNPISNSFPCFDFSHLKSTFDISVTHQPYLHVIGITQGTTKTNDDGSAVTTFNTTPKISPELVLFTITDIEPVKGQLITVWARKNLKNYVTEFLKKSDPVIFEKLLEFTGIKEDNSKGRLDLVVDPKTFMVPSETFGLIHLNESEMVSTPGNSNVVAKAMLRQLLYNYDGNSFDIVLRESFITYFSHKIISTDKSDEVYNLLSGVLDALETETFLDEGDVYVVSIPQLNPALRYTRIHELMKKRGAFVIGMLVDMLGEHFFETAIKNFFKSGSKVNFWEALTNEAHAQNKLAFNINLEDFVEIMQMTKYGYPVVKLTMNFTSNQLEATQQSYTNLITEKIRKHSKPETKQEAPSIFYTGNWKIPFKFISSRGPNSPVSVWLEQDKDVFDNPHKTSASEEWVLADPSFSVLARFDYEDVHWDSLISVVNDKSKSSILPAKGKARLYNDSMAFSWDGHKKYLSTLRVLSGLRFDRSLPGWTEGIRVIYKVKSLLKPFKDDYMLLQKFSRWLVAGIFKDLEEINKFDDVDVDKRRLYVLINEFACVMDLPECIERYQNKYDALVKFKRAYFARADEYSKKYAESLKQSESVPPVWEDRNEEFMEPELLYTLYSTIIRTSNDESEESIIRFFNDIVNHPATGEPERVTVLLALGCSDELRESENYMSNIFHKDPFLSSKDYSIEIFRLMHENPLKFSIASEFFYTEDWLAHCGIFQLDNVIRDHAIPFTRNMLAIEKANQQDINNSSNIDNIVLQESKAHLLTQADALHWINFRKLDLTEALNTIITEYRNESGQRAQSIRLHVA